MKHTRTYLLACGLAVILPPLQGFAQQNSGAPTPSVKQVPTERDGQHDFDFEFGSWNIHLKRRLNPLTGSNTWSNLTVLPSPSRFGMVALNWSSSKPIVPLPGTSKA